MQTITVIIPTFNEENYIQDCLQSVSFANQIILIDSFSDDNTIEIAKKFGCEIIKRKFDNFSAQKNEAIKSAKSDWILFLDADERVTAVSYTHLRAHETN
jgi:glycosyltransferase involved in cell wall biosynthesis